MGQEKKLLWRGRKKWKRRGEGRKEAGEGNIVKKRGERTGERRLRSDENKVY